MAAEIRITRRALREIEETVDWLSERSQIAAARWLEQLIDAIAMLEEKPHRFELAPEDAWYPGELRQLLHGKKRRVYRILFEIQGDVVYILRVRHGAQRLLKPGEL